MTDVSEQKVSDKQYIVKPVNVIPIDKHNKVIDPEKIFLAGTSIIDALRRQEMYIEYVNGSSLTVAGKKKSNRYINNVPAVALTSEFTKVDHVPGLKTLPYPHQQVAIKAMLDLEYCRTFTIQNTLYGQIYNISYNVGVLSEPVGSGKTIDLLSVILLAKTPRVLPDIMELPLSTSSATVGFIKRKFKKILLPTIIFVGISVMKQWENAIRTFTSLTYLTINGVKELRNLMTMMIDKSVNDYDIILVKNGKVTGKFEMPDGIKLEDKNKKGSVSIYNIIANFRNICWRRVIIDDFDTISLPHDAGIVNGLFTWYVSSTRKSMSIRTAIIPNTNFASEILKEFNYGCGRIMYNHILFHYMNVRNDINHIKETTMIPNLKYHVSLFKNPNDRYISLIGGIGGDQANAITEMLNGDAIGEAAEAAGIKTKSVADIFEQILGQQFKQNRFAGDLLAFIQHLQETEDDREPMSELPEGEKETYGKKDLLSFKEVSYKYPGVNKLIESTEEEYIQIKNESGKAIQRVKDNIKKGSCPICREDLMETKDTVIAKCCGMVFCGNCGIEGQNLKDRVNKLNGRCSNCRRDISIKDLIYMENFDLSKIENEEFEDEDTAIVPISVRKNKAVTKFTAITDIVRGIPIDSKRVDMFIPNVMKGGAYLPEVSVRKVLIFANFNETLDKVIEELEEEKIHYWRLMGNSSDIDEISREFTMCKTTCALVINSTKHCSGLNLQTATDLVFAHSIKDQAIESQVTGRGQRLGRKSPLNVWFMQYDNEYDTLANTHGVRDLSAAELDTERQLEMGNATTTIEHVTDNADACNLHHRHERNAPEDPKVSENESD